MEVVENCYQVYYSQAALIVYFYCKTVMRIIFEQINRWLQKKKQRKRKKLLKENI